MIKVISLVANSFILIDFRVYNSVSTVLLPANNDESNLMYFSNYSSKHLCPHDDVHNYF